MTPLPQSPVPSDRHLWPGEQPFTAFGQFGEGRLDLRVFDQDTWWVDRSGAAHLLDDMPLDYQANVIMFLRQHAATYHAAQSLRVVTQTVGNLILGLPQIPELDPATCVDVDAHTWLEGTPLMRRLRQLVDDTPS